MPGKRQMLWMVLPVVVCGLGAAGGDESLLTAARAGDTKALRTRTQQRANVNAREADGTTALHLAVLRDDIDAVDLLLRGGADPKAADRYGVTPLTVACINGNAGIIERLVKAGANPDTALASGEAAMLGTSVSWTRDNTPLVYEDHPKLKAPDLHCCSYPAVLFSFGIRTQSGFSSRGWR